MKEIITGFTLSVIFYGFLVFVSLSEKIEEENFYPLALATTFILGLASGLLAGKKGIKGSLTAFVLLCLLYSYYFHSRDALWIIGLLMIPILHIPIVFGFLVGYALKRKTEPGDSGNG